MHNPYAGAGPLTQRTWPWFCACVAAIAPGCGTGDAPPALRVRPAPIPIRAPARAVWVARFHYRSPDDVRAIIRNCAALGFNTILWQARGEATVTYPSQLEPWPKEFDHRDPGFDPLALAVAEAHRHGLRIEAWVNVLPGWHGRSPPPLAQHVYHQHPEWFLHDARGERQPLNDHYVLLNPCLPAVRRHIMRVLEELVSRYDVDGLHLDYVRYAWETTPDAARRYPRDPATLTLFRRETGLDPDRNAAAWNDWRANQLTRLVGEIRRTLDRRRPGATLTAAVVRDPQAAYRDYLQNAVAWLRTGLLDAAYPMVYTDKGDRFERDVQNFRRIAGPRARLIPGVGAYLQPSSYEFREQLAYCAAAGGDFAVFSYDALHATAQDRKNAPDAPKHALRAARRQVLAEFMRP